MSNHLLLVTCVMFCGYHRTFCADV